MFPGGEDLPLFTGTPMSIDAAEEFRPTPVPPPQLTMWDMRPPWGDPAASRPATEPDLPEV